MDRMHLTSVFPCLPVHEKKRDLDWLEADLKKGNATRLTTKISKEDYSPCWENPKKKNRTTQIMKETNILNKVSFRTKGTILSEPCAKGCAPSHS